MAYVDNMYQLEDLVMTGKSQPRDSRLHERRGGIDPNIFTPMNDSQQIQSSIRSSLCMAKLRFSVLWTTTRFILNTIQGIKLMK